MGKKLLILFLCSLPLQAKDPRGQVYVCYMTIEWVIKHNKFYKEEHGHYARKISDLNPNLRPCPWSRLNYVYKSDGKNYVIYCPGHHHEIDGARPNHPYHSSKTGTELQ